MNRAALTPERKGPQERPPEKLELGLGLRWGLPLGGIGPGGSVSRGAQPRGTWKGDGTLPSKPLLPQAKAPSPAPRAVGAGSLSHRPGVDQHRLPILQAILLRGL